MNISEDQIRLVHSAAINARRRSEEATKRKLCTRYQSRLAAMQAEEELAALQKSCRIALARSKGWTVGKKWFPIESLIAASFLRDRIQRIEGYPAIDHPECFVLNRRPVAIVSHTYGTWERCVQFSKEHNLSVEKLPFSWYYPDVTMAVVFTRNPRILA